MKPLFVLASILLLCAVVVDFFWSFVNKTTEPAPAWLRTFTVVKDLRIAIDSYFVDYGRFPLPQGQSQSADLRIQSSGAFIDSLIGKIKGWHPGLVIYMDPPPARDGKGGYIPAEGSTPSQLVDPWGSPYVILLDTSGDNAIENPDLKNLDPQIVRHLGESPPLTLQTDMAVFSLGKDKIEGTGDDIVSWRTWDAGAYDVTDWQAWRRGVLVVALTIGVVVACFYPWRPRVRDASPSAVS